MIWKMAWRNLWRNRRRSIITLISIAFGLLLSITFTTFAEGSYVGGINTAAKMNGGHVTIEPEGYRDAPSLKKTLPDAQTLADLATKTEGVKKVKIRVVGQAMAATASETVGASFFGIDPANETGDLFLLDHLVEGKPLENTTEKGVLIGRKMADQLDVRLKSKIVFTATDKNGEVVSGLLRVRGIFKTSVPIVDRSMVVVPIDWVRKLLGYEEREATQVAVQIDDQRNSTDLAAFFSEKAKYQKGTASAWYQTMPDLAGSIAMDRSSNYVMQIIIFILIGAGILNTVLMSVLERFREFGIMLAIGISPRRLGLLVMAETLMLAILGLILGLAVSMPVYGYLHTTGFDLTAYMKEDFTMGNIVWDPVIRAMMYPEHLIIILGGVFVLIMLAGLYPAYIATKTRALKAIQTI